MDFGTLDADIERQLEETQVVAELVKVAVKENASTAQSQEAYLKKYEALTERYEKAATELERLQSLRTVRSQQDKKMALYIRTLKKQPEVMHDWNDTSLTTLSDYEQRKAEAIAKQTEQPIIAQIMQIQSRMPHQNIPQSYLDDLHTLLYADNYDEDAINEELRKLKLEDYAAAVFQAMTDKTGLTEGFMPLPAKKSRKSKEILRYVK